MASPSITSPQTSPGMLSSESTGSAASSTEHWDDLSLHGSELRPEPPVVGQVDEFPDFTRELVRVEWRVGDPIDLYIVRPAGVVKPPVIVYLYGYPGEAVRFLNNDLCKTVTKRGFAAVGFRRC